MKRLFGGLLIAVGVLIATASGLCSLAVVAGELRDLGSATLTGLALPLIIGGIPFTVGVGAIAWGRYLLREAAEDRRLDRDASDF